MTGPRSTRESLVGRSFSNFDILEQLGAGGMGVVYRALDRKLGRSVALKFLSSAPTVEGEARERFIREARAASSLDHPNVGTIHGIEEGPDGELCIVMAYYEGETLANRISRGPIPVQEALRIAVQIAEGLAEAHSKGILHRDIKPSNILLTPHSGVKVVDFGLAKFMAGEQTVTNTSTFLGTAAYMSPEQVRGNPAGASSEIWALGAVLYEMVSGHRPFQGTDTYALLYAVVHDKPEPLAVGLAEFDRIVATALEKNPSKRHVSMRQLADELRLTAELVGARLGGSTDQLSHRSSKLPLFLSPARWLNVPFTGALAIAVLLAGLLFVTTTRGQILRFLRTGAWKAEPVSVAILPFTSKDDPTTGALAGGFAEALSGRIAQLERFADSLSIIRASELITKNIKDGAEARRLLGANLAITGTVSRIEKGGLQLNMEVRDERRPDAVKISLEDSSGDARALEDRVAAEISSILDIRASRQAMEAANRASTGARSAYESYLRGLGYMHRWDKPENLQSAIAAFGEAIRNDSGFALAYVGLSDASRTQFRIDRDPANIQHALNYAQRAIQLDPRLADAHVVLGRIYQETAERDLSVLEFQRALDLEPRNTAAIAGMGRSYEDLGRLTDAENAYKQAVSLNPYAWTPYNTLANFYLRQRRYTDAEEQFRRALRLTPDNPALYSNLGLVLMKRRKIPESIQMFQRSLELGPSHPAYLGLGNVYYFERKFRQAADAYEKALQLNSKDFRVWGTRAQALRLAGAAQGEVEQTYKTAIALGEEGLKLSPGQSRTLSLLGMYHACVGERGEALNRVQEALTKAGANTDVMIDAATAYEILGERQSAVRWAEKALVNGYAWDDFRTDPDFDELVKSGAVRAPNAPSIAR